MEPIIVSAESLVRNEFRRPKRYSKSLLILNNDAQSQEDQNKHISDVADVVPAFQCKICKFITFDKLFLLAHSKTCISDRQKAAPSTRDAGQADDQKEKVLFVCGQCSKQLESIEECRKHMINDHRLQAITASGSKPIKIEKTSENSLLKTGESFSKPTLDSKIKSKHTNLPKAVREYWSTPKTRKEAQLILRADRKIKCTYKYCLYKFNTTEAMNLHFSCHKEPAAVENGTYKKSTQKTPVPLYSCFNCPKTFTNWPSCSLHLWREHKKSLDLLICPICFNLRTHGVAKMMEHLARHWRKMKPDSNPTKMETDSENSEKSKSSNWYDKIKCEICEKLFSDCKSLKKHVQGVHKKIKPFICNVCGHSATRKHMMQLHMRQHTGEKPYACTFCEYRTGDHNTLRKHIMRHTGEKPYKCDYCPYASIQSVALKYHMKSAHSDKLTKTIVQISENESIS